MKATLTKVYYMDTAFGYKIGDEVEVEKVNEIWYEGAEGNVFNKNQLEFI